METEVGHATRASEATASSTLETFAGARAHTVLTRRNAHGVRDGAHDDAQVLLPDTVLLSIQHILSSVFFDGSNNL